MSFYLDCHLHSFEKYDFSSFSLSDDLAFCTVSSDLNDFSNIETFSKVPNNIIIKKAFGIHPWKTDFSQFDSLQTLLNKNKVQAIGEIGLDFFSDELKADKSNQIKVFLEQIKLAKENSLPVIIHLRSAIAQLFENIRELQDLKAVIFHAFPGSPQEALSILKKVPQSYFSFGASLLSGRKNSLRCIKELDVKHILLESDFPFQKINTVLPLYKSLADIKGLSEESLCSIISDTFHEIFS